jgi:exodeoxyribonuclease V alpha subunit
MPDLRKPEAEIDFYFVDADDPETAVPRIIELVKTRIPRRFGLDPIRDVQVLCPMNRGGVGARSLNIELNTTPCCRSVICSTPGSRAASGLSF